MNVARWGLGSLFCLAGTLAIACSSARAPREGETESAASPLVSAVAPLAKGAFLHGQLRQPKFTQATAPFGAHLSYFGGRVVSNIQVVQVLYGQGSYIPQVTSTDSPSVATFYQGVLNSPYVDWLSEYNTTTTNVPDSGFLGSNQVIGRGSFSTQVMITPSLDNDGSVIDDMNIQAELSAQIQAGNLPQPTRDVAGNNNTYYAVFFPHGKVITLQGATSCEVFCAYHSTVANAGGAGEVYYGVHPDFQPGSGCEFGCGAASTVFGNYTQVASHELVETITDAEIGLAATFGPPLSWYDESFNEEIGDLCNDQNAQIVGGDGVTYDVQTEFSNSQNDCIVQGPQIDPLLVQFSENACGNTPATATVTAIGGPEGFPGDVALSLTGVNPAPPPGGEITATFNPNPVPAPPLGGSTATMQIQATAATPSGTYTLTLQGASGDVTATAVTTLVLASAAPGAPGLVTPANGADGVPLTPTFTWSPAPTATSYTLDLLSTTDCSGTPLHSYTTTGTTFTVPDALTTFQPYSWRVTASNACGSAGSVSSCFQFVTESCASSEAITNGGFENGLTGWSSDALIPPPVITTSNPHSGSNAMQLGTIVTGMGEPLGDSAISQVITLGSSAPDLVFWMWPLSQDTVQFDQQYVRVTPLVPPGPTVVLMNEANNAQTYVRREFSLAQFAGQTVQLTFGVHQDGFGDVTGMLIDDVSIGTSVCGPPDFGVSVAPGGSDEICAGSPLAFNVGVSSLHGPNFTSPVQLSASALPPGGTAVFGQNPVSPGATTTLTLNTVRPTVGNTYTFNVTGTAVTPPPSGPRTAVATVVIDANVPNAPQAVSPSNGQIDVPLQPTLTFTAPLVPDAKPAATALVQTAFGASQYHLQLALDAAFTNVVIDTTLTSTFFTPASNLSPATRYFWRVAATNACGTSPWSTTASFIVGACSEGWNELSPVPQAPPSNGGLTNASAVAVPEAGKIYVVGGLDEFNVPLNQTWAYDPASDTWTRKSDVPSPGVGGTDGSAVELGGTIYVFGGNGFFGLSSTLWRYDVSTDTWTRGADLPFPNSGAAVAAIGGKIYIAYGAGFGIEAWQYDPAADGYTRIADPPPVPATFGMHGVALAGELHAFAGGSQGKAHVVYTPATDTWRAAPDIPVGVTDPAVGELGGKAYVVGGRPTALTQIFDPATGGWSQGAPLADAANGLDTTSGAVLGVHMHVFGGSTTLGVVSTHWQLHTCSAGALSSTAFLPFVVDGDGHTSGVTNEQTTLLIDNALSGTPLTATCFLYGKDGTVLANASFTAAPGELHTVPNIVRTLRGATTVQNINASLAIFATDLFQVTASIVNNATSDSAFEQGQPIAGQASGFIPMIAEQPDATQAVFSNVSTNTALVQLVAYPAAGGMVPSAATLAVVPAFNTVNYADVVQQLGLPSGFLGALTFSSNQPVAAVARALVPRHGYSGFVPVRSSADAGSTQYVPYVEDTTSFSSSLVVNNPGLVPANVTVGFVDTEDSTGASPGTETTRDVLVPVNAATSIADVVRWVLRQTTNTPSGKRGFLVVTTPQAVTAQATLVDRATSDPAISEIPAAITSAFSPLLVRVAPLPLSPATEPASTMTVAASSTTFSRVALSNPSTTTATVELSAINASGGTPTAPFVLTLSPNGQFFTEDLAGAMDLPPVFLGWVTVQSDKPVLVYNQRRSGDTGDAVPVFAQ